MSYQLPDGTWVPQVGDVWTFDGAIWRPVTGTPIGAWGLLANLPDDRALANVVGTGQAGDLLEANAANQLVVNAAVLPHQAAGRLMQGKIGAAVQLVLVGSVD